MGRSRSRSRSRERRREKRPADEFLAARDYDREYADRRNDVDYRNSRTSTTDYRERERDDFREKDRGRDKDRERDRDRDRGGRPEQRRSRSRERDDRRKDRRRPAVDEFGRVIDYEREKSMSPDRPRKFDPRKLRRSESPEPEAEAVKEPKLKNEHLFQITSDDDPETAAAKMEMEAMAKMGLPVQLDTTKGKGNVQSDKFAQTGAVRIKPQRQARQYMNRRCGFNKPLPAEPTRKVHGIGTKEQGVNNVSW